MEANEEVRVSNGEVGGRRYRASGALARTAFTTAMLQPKQTIA
jgi:hypothetical protein